MISHVTFTNIVGKLDTSRHGTSLPSALRTQMYKTFKLTPLHRLHHISWFSCSGELLDRQQYSAPGGGSHGKLTKAWLHRFTCDVGSVTSEMDSRMCVSVMNED